MLGKASWHTPGPGVNDDDDDYRAVKVVTCRDLHLKITMCVTVVVFPLYIWLTSFDRSFDELVFSFVHKNCQL